MCGYIIYPTKPSKDLLLTHLERQKHRGEDGYGTMSMKLKADGKPYVGKALLRNAFIKKHRYMPVAPMIVHHRKASLGGVKAELVHPLANETDNVLVMQNGTKRPLAAMFYTSSDTLALAEMWDEVSDLALHCLLADTGVVFVMDRGRLFFHRDSGRTLYKCTAGDYAGMYASEPIEAGMWALVDEYDLKELPLDMAEWDLEHGESELFQWQECQYYLCKTPYLGTAGSYRCPDCDSKYVQSYSSAANNRRNNTRQQAAGGK